MVGRLAGWQVDLLVLNINDAAYLGRVSQKVNLVVLGVSQARNAPLPLLRYIRNNKPEKLLVFNYVLAVIMVMLRSIFRFKTKIIARNINTFSKSTAEPRGLWLRYIVRPLINHFYAKCDHIINQCQAMHDDLVSVFPHLADKTSVIYNPVAKHVEDYAKTHDLTQVEKQDNLLCVGRLQSYKSKKLFTTLLKVLLMAKLESYLVHLIMVNGWVVCGEDYNEQ